MDKNDFKDKFIEKVKGLLIEKDIDVKTLAEKTKIPYSSLISWLNKTRTIQVESLIVLADFFGVTIDYLVGRED